MKLLNAVLLAGFAMIVLLPLAKAKPEYAKKEHKSCTYCHVKMGSKELNDTGKYYKEHDHSFKGYKGEEEKKN